MIILLVVLKVDYGPMRIHEENAKKGDLFTTEHRPYEEDEQEPEDGRGIVADLVLPVVVLIAGCIIGMIYTGGFFEGAGFIDAFANSDASIGLVMGGFVALVFTFVYYMLRNVISFQEFTACIPEGF